MTFVPAAPVRDTPGGEVFENSWMERLWYLAVAGVWYYCITAALAPLGDGGIQSRRDMNMFMIPLMAVPVFLVGSAITSRATKLGYAARFLAVVGIGAGAAASAPLVAVYGLWFLGSAIGLGSAKEPLLFFGGLLAVACTLPILLRGVARRP